MIDERTLVGSILNGNKEAFKLLVNQYQRLVLHMAARIIQDDHELEDLCQEIFIKVYEQLSKFKFQSKLSTWIATIAYRTAINHAKKNKRSSADQLSEDNLQTAETDPETLYSKKDITKIVHQQIKGLPVHYRTILTLYHLEEMNYQEIRKVTGLPEGTVKNYLFRARKILKKNLESYSLKEEIL
ncbi:RNA polymerase sigma factor [Xanthovirga aplysinae]|uniref:RNA polymerase sigma factor n=1 Tax=Xanthovirga aplysinae TaxID=2529853 RepID=UPI0012BC8113|nr:RNA polymerase sigma factor [Xanthovirga aplysinae]MTI32503.1 RNA polymerase sigma factor [Xanthovirga aplysinae]